MPQQRGHSDTSVTSRHYAQWVGELYSRPLELEESEVPADLLARIGAADEGEGQNDEIARPSA